MSRIECPNCKKDAGVPIVYGIAPPPPGTDAVGGGCMITADSPAYACRECGHRWGKRD